MACALPRDILGRAYHTATIAATGATDTAGTVSAALFTGLHRGAAGWNRGVTRVWAAALHGRTRDRRGGSFYHHPVRAMASLQRTFAEAASQGKHKEPAKHDVSGESGEAARQAQGEQMSGAGEETRAEGSEEVRAEQAEAYEKDMDDYGSAYATRSSDEGFGQIYGEPVTHFGVRGRVGNAPAAWTEEESKLDRTSEPAGREEYDRSQGASVGQTEEGWHAIREKAMTQEVEGGSQGFKS
ncbi:unnamed protein product [Closterium sp. Naga37s-1]|nr:unnamed protein product [Closterium sp. Naga37s-1]